MQKKEQFNLKEKIKTFKEDDKEYFRSNRQSIAIGNSHLLNIGCAVYAFVLLFYTILTAVLKQSQMLLNMYLLFDAIHLVYCIIVFKRSRRKKYGFISTQHFCSVFEISVLCFFLVEAVFPFPNTHSLYTSIAIILITIIYSHRAPYIFSLIFFYTSAYAILSFLFKTQAAFENDILIALATFISSVIGYIATAILRHNEKKALIQLKYANMIDPLTETYNKQTIESLCTSYMTKQAKESFASRSYAFIILDIDDFKHFNDVYGHQHGDDVLAVLGHLLKSTLKKPDYVGRFGGDEFIAMVTEEDNHFDIKETMNKLMSKIEKVKFDFTDDSLHCSIGVALSRTPKNGISETFDSIFRRADNALYFAKKNGKNRYSISK